MAVKVTFAVIIMSSYILIFDSNFEAYIDSSITERIMLLVKSIVISASVYFLSLFISGVRVKDL